MGTAVNSAYIERLQEDIIIACRRLEENGHDSLVVTVNADGHLVFGSEKGKLFLQSRHAFITDFIQCCQNAATVVKVERDQDHDAVATNKRKKQHKYAKHKEKVNKKNDAAKNDFLHTPGPAEFIETSMFYEDTDGYDESEIFDASLLARLEDGLDGKDKDELNENTPAKTDIKNTEKVIVKKEKTDTEQTATETSLPEAGVVLEKVEETVNASERTGLRSRSVPKTVKKTYHKKKKRNGTPTCDICDRTLFSWEGVKRHKVFVHQTERHHKCEICGAAFKARESLKKHKIIHGAAIHKCEICDKAFTNPRYLKRHMFVHSDQKPFVCEDCGKGFIFKSVLAAHKKTHDKFKPYKCEGCEKEFMDYVTFKDHLKNHKLEDLVCGECGKQCNCKSKLDRHLAAHKAKAERPPKKDYTCEVCGKPNSCGANLQKHMVLHMDTKPFVCEICGRSYSSKQHLQNHARLHTGEKPYKCTYEGCNMTFRTCDSRSKHLCYHSNDYPFVCDICGQKFKEKGCMRHHRKKHITEFRWPCEYCTEKFRTLVRYKTHIVRFHVDKRDEVAARTNIKFWPCSICPKVFGQKEDYEQHMNVHLGLKPFKCNACEKAFSSKSNLMQHVKGHTGFNKLRCNYCSKSYSDPKMLKEHLKNRHGRNVDTLTDTGVKNKEFDESRNNSSEQNMKAAFVNAQIDHSNPAEPSNLIIEFKSPAAPIISPMFSNNFSGESRFSALRLQDHMFHH